MQYPTRSGDKVIFLGGLAVVMTLLVATILFPIYQLLDGTIVRRPLWSPPQIPIRHAYDELAPQDIERLMKDPVQRQLLESMKSAPRSFEPRPIWIGNRWGPPKNRLAFAFAFTALGYVALLKWRGII